MNRSVNKYNRNTDQHACASWPAGCIPVQAIQTILPQRAHEPIKDFHNSNQDIEFEHGLSTDPVIQFSNADWKQNTAVDQEDNADLYQLIGVPVYQEEKISASVSSAGQPSVTYCNKK